MPWARTTTSFGPQHELPLARLVIHRQTSAHEQRRERLKVRFEVGHDNVNNVTKKYSAVTNAA